MKRTITTLAITTIAIFGCKKKDVTPPPSAPLVQTAALTNVAASAGTATAGGSIVSDGGNAITKSGVVWSKTNLTPALASDSIVTTNATTGAFTVNISGIDFGQTYYFRAFASNSVGTGYGDVVTLTTSNDSVKFTYNGQSVTYGIIISPTTGKKWLDRNLGALQVATSYDDYKAYGDLFQWGRPADGHQLINWTASDAGNAVNGTSTVLATTDNPGHYNFILPLSYNDFPYYRDWRSDNKSKRWATAPQGPCPAGWHVPTIAEWLAEVSNTSGGAANSGGMTDVNTGYRQLKLTVNGNRLVDGPGSVNFYQVGRAGHYWSISEESNSNGVTKATDFNPGLDYIQTDGSYKSSALCIRCLKD